MKHKPSLTINILLLVFTLLIAACGQASATETEFPDTKSETELPDAEDAVEELQTITQVVIDGKMDDWSGYKISGLDISEEHPPGSPDLKSMRAFSNDSYFYMFIEFHEMGNYDHFYFSIVTESDTEYQLTLFKGGSAQIENKSTNKIKAFFANLAVNSGYEFKIPLSVVNNEEINWIQANVYLGHQGHGDNVKSSILFNVDEIESPVQPDNLNEIPTRPVHFQLASRAKGDYVYRSFLQLPVDMTIGPDGNLYVADSDGKHIVRVSPDGEMDDLGLWKTVEALRVDGPRSVAFDSKGILYFANHGHIFRYDIENDYLEELSGIEGGIGSIAFDQNDNLYYTDREENHVRKWNETGESEIFFTTEIHIDDDLVFNDEGFLYLIAKNDETQMKGLLKVNLSTGEETEFEKILHSGDIIYIDIDNEGDIWVRGGSNRLYQFAPNGDLKPYTMNGLSIDDGFIGIGCGAGVAVDGENGVWAAEYSSKLIYFEPEVSGGADPGFISKAVSPGFVTRSIALGPNSDIYTFNKNTQEIWKIDSNGVVEVIKSFENVGHVIIAISPENEIYLSLQSKGEVVRLEEDGSLTHVANVQVYNMVFGADGNLYATTRARPYSVVKITAIDEYETIATKLAGDPIGTWETDITPAMDRGLYVLTVNNENIYFIDFEGNSELVKDVKEHMTWVMAASPIDGTLYFISHFITGYHLARMDTDGRIDEYGYNFIGDPWAMVVSNDGKWLYVGSSGAISKVPIQD